MGRPSSKTIAVIVGHIYMVACYFVFFPGLTSILTNSIGKPANNLPLSSKISAFYVFLKIYEKKVRFLGKNPYLSRMNLYLSRIKPVFSIIRMGPNFLEPVINP